jgi:spore germination protein GerM
MGSPRRLILFAALIVIGVGLHTLPAVGNGSNFAHWLAWTQPTIATLYFSDGTFLVPVSRRLGSTDDVARAALRALLDGPAPHTNLTTFIPSGTAIRSLAVNEGVATVDLKTRPDVVFTEHPAITAIVQTLTSLPGITMVTLTVNGAPVVTHARRTPLLYYASSNGLAALEADRSSIATREALDVFLRGPADSTLIGLPSDVRLLKYEEDAARAAVTLDFSYTDSLRTLASEKPDVMRFVLLGLIATLTDLADVHTVTLNFGGHSRLGLGQCSDLLRVPQPRPQLLNDERLLGT